MTYAIIEASGKQFRVEPGRFYDIDRLAADEDEAVTLDKVLYVSHEGDIMVGQPLVEGATVSATVMRHLRGRKVIVYKMQPKKKTRKKRGHRQELTRLMIDAISLNGNILAGEETASDSDIEKAAPEEFVETSPEVATTEGGEEVSAMAPTEVVEVAPEAANDEASEAAPKAEVDETSDEATADETAEAVADEAPEAAAADEVDEAAPEVTTEAIAETAPEAEVDEAPEAADDDNAPEEEVEAVSDAAVDEAATDETPEAASTEEE